MIHQQHLARLIDFAVYKMDPTIFSSHYPAKGKDTKTVQVSIVNQKQRKEVRDRLSSAEGDQKYRQRKIDVEPVFGQVKHNMEFKRFSLRGLSKNTTDWGLICVAHNLKKWQTTSIKQVKISKN